MINQTIGMKTKASLLAAAAVLLLSGCGGGGPLDDFERPTPEPYLEPYEEPYDAEPYEEPDEDNGEGYEDLFDDDPNSGDGCVWDPTMNYDWHDDYVCGGVRQYFLPYDDFIEQWEIDQEAREWEERNL